MRPFNGNATRSRPRRQALRVIMLSMSALVSLGGASQPVMAQVNPYPDIQNLSMPDVQQLAPYLDPLLPFASSDPTNGLFPDLPNRTAETVLRFNACGRELDHAMIRAQMQDASIKDISVRYGFEGSELTSILIAKIAWLNNRATANMNCAATMVLNPTTMPAYGNVWATAAVLNAVTSYSPCKDADVITASVPPAASHGIDFTLHPRQPKEMPIGIVVTVTPNCMRLQVNQAILSMKKYGNLGTSGVPCVGGVTTDGEWDAKNRELVRILYMGTQTYQASTQYVHAAVLDQDTITHMERDGLLAASGPVGSNYYNIPLISCDDYDGDQSGGPQDIEDQGDFGNTLLRDLGDAFGWAIDLLIKIEVGAELGAVTEIVPLFAAPFLVAPQDDPWGTLVPSVQVAYEETENHRIQIEVSRYLTNAYYIQYQSNAGLEYQTLLADQQGVSDWLQNRLQSIAFNDFMEYNAHDYTTYSLQSLVNLYDFTTGTYTSRFHDAAQVVLDLSEAKFAAGSNLGRRLAPFRRHDFEDGYTHTSDTAGCPFPYLYHGTCGEDQEVIRAMALAQQTQLIPNQFPISYCPSTLSPTCIEAAVVPGLVNTVLSTYTLPSFIRDIIVDRPGPLTQRIKHAGDEYYYQEHSFTASAGGIRTPALYKILGVGSPSARGDAMPSVIIPSTEGVSVDDVFSFVGVGTAGDRTDNLCLYKGFICGLNAHIPEYFQNCSGAEEAGADGHTVFVNSSKCPDGGIDPTTCGSTCTYTSATRFFLMAWTAACEGGFCPRGTTYGFMEAVDASTFGFVGADPVKLEAAYQAFKVSRTNAIQSLQFDINGNATYTNAGGQAIQFRIDNTLPTVVQVDGVSTPAITTAGDILTSDGKGTVHIGSPYSSQHIDIDYTDASAPKWQFTP